MGIIYQSQEKSIKNFGKSSRGHSQGLRKVSGHLQLIGPIQGASRRLFAIAPLSCYSISHKPDIIVEVEAR